MEHTKTDKSIQLSEQQLTAIEYILEGMSDEATAEKCGVTRQTVWKWRNRDPIFISTLNQRREEIWIEARERLKSLVSKALDVMDRNLDSDDPKISMAAAVYILKRVIPGDVTSSVSPKTPEDVIYQWERPKAAAEVNESHGDTPSFMRDPIEISEEIDRKTRARVKRAKKDYGL